MVGILPPLSPNQQYTYKLLTVTGTCCPRMLTVSMVHVLGCYIHTLRPFLGVGGTNNYGQIQEDHVEVETGSAKLNTLVE